MLNYFPSFDNLQNFRSGGLTQDMSCGERINQKDKEKFK